MSHICTDCDKNFSRSSYLKHHYVLQHNKFFASRQGVSIDFTGDSRAPTPEEEQESKEAMAPRGAKDTESVSGVSGDRRSSISSAAKRGRQSLGGSVKSLSSLTAHQKTTAWLQNEVKLKEKEKGKTSDGTTGKSLGVSGAAGGQGISKGSIKNLIKVGSIKVGKDGAGGSRDMEVENEDSSQDMSGSENQNASESESEGESENSENKEQSESSDDNGAQGQPPAAQNAGPSQLPPVTSARILFEDISPASSVHSFGGAVVPAAGGAAKSTPKPTRPRYDRMAGGWDTSDSYALLANVFDAKEPWLMSRLTPVLLTEFENLREPAWTVSTLKHCLETVQAFLRKNQHGDATKGHRSPLVLHRRLLRVLSSTEIDHSEMEADESIWSSTDSATVNQHILKHKAPWVATALADELATSDLACRPRGQIFGMVHLSIATMKRILARLHSLNLPGTAEGGKTRVQKFLYDSIDGAKDDSI